METPGVVRIGREGNWLIVSRGQSGATLWSLDVEVHADGLTARTNVWLGPEGIEEPLDEFFSHLAEDWRGWTGPKTWKGMEGGLRLTCVHDGVGAVHVGVELDHLSGAGWAAQASIPLDPGQLDQVAADLRRLLHGR